MNETLENKHDTYKQPPTFSEYDPAILARLAEAPRYRKNGKVGAVQVTRPVEIETILVDGTKETSQVANPGDWVVRNARGDKVEGEEWVIEAEDFNFFIRRPSDQVFSKPSVW